MHRQISSGHLDDGCRQILRFRNFLRTQNGLSDDRFRVLRRTSGLRRNPASLRHRMTKLKTLRTAGRRRRRLTAKNISEAEKINHGFKNPRLTAFIMDFPPNIALMSVFCPTDGAAGCFHRDLLSL